MQCTWCRFGPVKTEFGLHGKAGFQAVAVFDGGGNRILLAPKAVGLPVEAQHAIHYRFLLQILAAVQEQRLACHKMALGEAHTAHRHSILGEHAITGQSLRQCPCITASRCSRHITIQTSRYRTRKRIRELRPTLLQAGCVRNRYIGTHLPFFIELVSNAELRHVRNGGAFFRQQNQILFGPPILDQGVNRSRTVLLAIGRRGTPRKLGVPGEDLPKVVYRLIDPEQYRNMHVLVVGGGDSALEAACSIAEEPGTTVTLSYRSEAFGRSKQKNRDRLEILKGRGKLKVMLKSNIKGVTKDRVAIEHEGQIVTMKNDAIIVCAGGILPTPFLKEIGIIVEAKFGTE